jgi:hypothetical protein
MREPSCPTPTRPIPRPGRGAPIRARQRPEHVAARSEDSVLFSAEHMKALACMPPVPETAAHPREPAFPLVSLHELGAGPGPLLLPTNEDEHSSKHTWFVALTVAGAVSLLWAIAMVALYIRIVSEPVLVMSGHEPPAPVASPPRPPPVKRVIPVDRPAVAPVATASAASQRSPVVARRRRPKRAARVAARRRARRRRSRARRQRRRRTVAAARAAVARKDQPRHITLEELLDRASPR